ncbi:MAG: pseudouridine synthase [Lachnospiraceae bacterium]|nr:pseudouridine synthase [Lachnospiraceae bacterium]
MDTESGIRINKYIASCGVCSRRDADKLIESGKVTLNGKPAAPGDRVMPGDSVKVGKKLLTEKTERTVLAYYKPVGVTCTERDSHADVTLKDVLRYKERVTYAGRLDRDSEGLLLLTDDGDLIQAMMKGENGHEKEYVVKISKPVTKEFVEKMSEGIYLKDLNKTTRPCKVERVTKDSFSIILTQGMNRQIRRMCETLDVKVLSLKRVRVLTVTLGKLKPGEYRKLSNAEVEELKAATENGRGLL